MCVILTGCNVGMTPSGGSDAQVRAGMDALPLDQQAKIIMMSPAPMEHKMKQIQDAYAKAGKPVPPEYQSGGASPPGSGAPAHG